MSVIHKNKNELKRDIFFNYFSNSIASTTDSSNEAPKEVEPVEREGILHIKFTVLDGKVNENVLLFYLTINLTNY